MSRSAANRFRTRKLSNKQHLSVLRENQIDCVDDEQQRNIPAIETGVERQEEIEHHLQVAINAAQAAATGAKDSKKIFIPTPNTSEIPASKYEKLYPKRFQQPSSYIRFSATVEDCSGIGYCMSEQDDKELVKLNQKKPPHIQTIAEEDFERVVDLFEGTIQERQPYLSMDVANLMPYDEMEKIFDQALGTKEEENFKWLTKSLYPYWKDLKIGRGGRSIIPFLKFEQGNEKDDGDPYVCFRRREVRGVRKTRRTDAQSSEKLKRLRQEIETARGLVRDIFQREKMRQHSFEYDRQIFEKRRTIVDIKRKLGLKGDDEDLINKPKRARMEQAVPPPIRIPPRYDGKPPEADLRQLTAVLAEEKRRQMEKYHNLQKARSTAKYGLADITAVGLPRPLSYEVTDITESIISPTINIVSPVETSFCGVQAFYITPPSSVDSSPSSPPPSDHQQTISVLQTSPKSTRIPTFRRRIGRGGRVLVDRRRHPSSPPPDANPYLLDRLKFDNNDDDPESAFPIFRVDPHSEEQIKFRSRMLEPPQLLQQQQQQQRKLLMQQQQHVQQHVQQVQVAQPQIVVNGNPGMPIAR